MVAKQFSNNLHDTYDDLGRFRAYKLFNKYFDVELQDNQDTYGVDLVAYRDNQKVGYVEVEVRAAWDGLFPFDTLNIPYRKKKLLENNLPTVLVAFNKQGTLAYICKDITVLNSPVVEIKNKYMAKGEMFYQVPLDKIKLVTL